MLKQVTLSVKNIDVQASCPKCCSNDFAVKCGLRYNRSGLVQRYYCKRCKKWFTDRIGFEGMKNQATAIVSALDLYYRNLSLRQIGEHLESLYGIKVSYGAIYYWLKKYVELIHSYIKNFQAKNSERWHADDSLIKVSGRDLVVWSLLDSETRFLIAVHISRRKSTEDASLLLTKGLKASENKPLEIVTDGLPSYRKAIEKEFSEKYSNTCSKIIHIQGPLTGSVNNNKIERFYGLFKGRIKSMYHLNSTKGAETFSKGFRIHYNFVRGHKALGNKTPAQAAGISPVKSTWGDLIVKATRNSEK
jgi:transposase-like protein